MFAFEGDDLPLPKEDIEMIQYDKVIHSCSSSLTAGAGSGGLQTQQLQTGRRSACGDDTQEGAAMEAELTRLQRLLHVMEGDRRSYSEESNNILRKQQ